MKMGKYDIPYITLDLETGPQTFGLKMEYRYCENCKKDHFVIRLIGVDNKYEIRMNMEEGSIGIDNRVNGSIEIIDAMKDFLEKKGTYNKDYISFMYGNLKYSSDLRSEALVEFEKGTMLEYCRVMGVDNLQYLVIDDKDYILMDSYCITPDCECTDVALNFFDGFNRDGETPSIFSFVFDYETGEVKKSMYLKMNDAKKIADDFDEEFRGLLRERHQSLKMETRHLFNLSIDDEIISKLKKTKKVGRNDPCPCGSGKKYKKCCLSKQMGYAG